MIGFDGNWLRLKGLKIGENEGFQFRRIGLRSVEKREGSWVFYFQIFKVIPRHDLACCDMS